MSKQPGLIDRDFVRRMREKMAKTPLTPGNKGWIDGEHYRAMVIAVLALAGRPVKPEVFRELAEDDEEWADFCGAFTDLIHVRRIVPIDGKLVLCK